MYYVSLYVVDVLYCGPPRWGSSKESACNAGDPRDSGLVPGSRRFPWSRKLQPGQTEGPSSLQIMGSQKTRNAIKNSISFRRTAEWSNILTGYTPLREDSYESKSLTREDSTHGYHQMVNTEIRLIIFFAAKDGEALYSQQKQDQELPVAQIMSSLLPNSDLNEESRENH